MKTMLFFYMSRNPKMNPEDYLRFGIIEYEKGQLDKSWQHVSCALLSDLEIENRKHAYKSYITRIIRKKFGAQTDIAHFLKLYRTNPISQSV